MANWSNPTLTSLYTDFLTQVKDRDTDLALQFDGTTSTNIPTNAIRWNSSVNRWQKWSGSAWGELATTYALTGLSTTGNASIGGTLGVTGATSLATATATTPATGDNSTAVATTAFVRAQAYATLASPALTGTPTAPTAAVNTNTTQIATTAYTRSQISTEAVLLSGGTMTGQLTLSADPSSPLHAATYQWVQGFPAKIACRVATTANLVVTATSTTLTNAGSLTALSIDGQSLTVGRRVLVKDQTAAAQNGIYEVTNAGSGSVAWVLTRASDANTWNDITGAIVSIELGTANIETLWYCSVASGGTIGTTLITWQLVSNPQTEALGNLSSSGFVVRTAANTFTSRSIAVSGNGLSITNDDGISANPTITSNATSTGTTANTIICRGTNGDYTAGIATLSGALFGPDPILVNDTARRTLAASLLPRIQVANTSQDGSAVSIGNYSTATGSEPSVNLFKSISGTIGTNTAVTNGSNLGSLRFHGAASASAVYAGAEILVATTETWTASTAATKLTLRTTPSGSTTVQDRLVINSNGVLNSQASYDNTVSGSTLTVTSAGVIGRTSSSIKYKKDIEDLESSIVDNAIDNLRPVWYRSKRPSGDEKVFWSHIGLIAEEVDLVEPRLVKYRTDSVSYDENGSAVIDELEKPEPEDVDYARLAVLLLSEAQRQKKIIAELQDKIDNLIEQ